MADLTLPYTVHAVDVVAVEAETEIDGEAVTVRRQQTVVELLPAWPDGIGTLTLRLTKAQAEGHPFVAGEAINVTFGGEA